jgi:hypothetical protein
MLRPRIGLQTNRLLRLGLKTRLRPVQGTPRIAQETIRRVRKIKLRPGPKPANLLPLAPTTKWRVHRRITGKTRRVPKTTKNRKPLQPNTLHARRTLLTRKLRVRMRHVRMLPVQLPRRVRKANRSRNVKLGRKLNVHPARRVPSRIRRQRDHRLRLTRKQRPAPRNHKRRLAKKSLRRKNTNHKSV